MTSPQPSKWDLAKDLYSEGASDVEVAKLFEITEKAFEKLYSENSKFAAFVDTGRTLAKAWYMEKLRKNVGNKDFNTTLFNFAMKNKYSWADRTETTTVANDDQLSVQQLRDEFQRLASGLEKTDPGLVRANLQIVSGGKSDVSKH